MATIRRTPLARSDLKGIGRYIAQQSGSREIAFRFLDTIERRSQIYANSPLSGELCPDFSSEVRRFSVGNYVVFYRPSDSGIELLRVLHGARDIPAVWRKYLLGGESG
jgi:toxin ParE1/3/4